MNKIILLIVFLISSISWSQTSNQTPFELCLQSKLAAIQTDLQSYYSTGQTSFYIITRVRTLETPTYIASYYELALTNGSIPPQLIYWRYMCEEDNFFESGYSSVKRVVSSIQKNNLPPNETPDPTACGSVINYSKGSVSEQIPIAGTEFEISYNSFFNPDLLNNSKVQISYQILKEKGYDHRVKLMNKAGDLLDTSYYSSLFDFINYEKFGSFSEAVTSESDFFKISEFRLGLDRSLVVQTPHPDDPTHSDQNWLPSDYGSYKTIYQYKPRAWGLSGWNITNHHYFDKNSKTMFTGYGDTITYESFKTLSIAPYGQVNIVVDKNSGSEIYIFDSQGRHLETRDTNWNKPITRFEYSGNKISKIINRYNLETSFNYNSDNQLVSIVSPYGLVTKFTISNNNIEKVINPLNQEYIIAYGAQKEMTSFKSPSGVITTFEYSPEGRFLKETKNNGLMQSFSETFIGSARVLQHNLNNYIKSYIKTELPSQYTTDNAGVGSEISVQDSENRLVYKDTLYPDQFLKRTQNNEEDVTTSYNYTSFWGRDLVIGASYFRKIASIGSDFNEITSQNTQTTVSTADNISTLSKTIKFTQSNKNSTTVLDSQNKLISYSDSDGFTSSMKLNEVGLPIEVKEKDKPTKYLTYDQQYRLVKIQQGTSYNLFSYDQYGYISEMSTSSGDKTTYVRNILGQVLTTTLPNGDSIAYEYTDAGSIKKMILPNGETHYFSYSLGDYLIGQINPSNKSVFYDYDSDKRLTKITKASGKTMEYIYKQNSENLDSIKSSEGTIKLNSIDSNGRVRDITSHDNIRLETSWISNQINDQKWYDDDGSLIATLSTGFRKDKLAINSYSLNGVEYVNYGAGDISSSNSINYKIYCYTNQIQKGVYCNAGSITYNVFTSASSDENATLINSKLVRKVSNSSTNYISYTDEIVKSLSLFGEMKSISEKTYGVVSYDLNNQDSFNKSKLTTVGYDSNIRMTSSATNMSFLYGGKEVSNFNETRNFSYPPKSNNNIKEYSLNGKRTTASHNSEDQLIKLSGATNKDFQYTDDGFLKSATSCKGTTLFDYDSFGNLKKVSLADGRVIEYKVDGLNRRIKKLVNGQIKEYYLWYDQIHLAAILDENKQAKVKFIYSIDSTSASAIEKNGTLYKLIHDPGLGSIRYAINVDTQEIAQEIEYDELGNITYNSNKDFQPLAYAGGLFDSDTGLTRFGARDYDPTIGRWTSKDPIGFLGGDTNLYNYVANNPLSYIDPSGFVGLEIGGGLASQLGLPGASAGKNWAFSFDFSTGQWQTGTTTTVQARVGGGAYLGAGLNISITPFANSVCDLGGHSGGIGGDAGVGLVGGGVQLGWGSAGPIISGSRWGVGAGVTGYGFYNYSSAQVTNQGNLYQMLGFGK